MSRLGFGWGLLGWVTASAAPVQLHHQGRLVDGTGAVVQGQTALTVALYAAATGGSAAFTDTLTVPVADGFYSVTLGATPGNSLDSSVLMGDVWVEVRVGGTPLGPRTPLLSVPRAVVATSVDGGVVEASRIEVVGTGSVVLGQISGSTCVDQGAISFEPVAKQLRVCIDGSWQGVQGVKTVALISGQRRWSDGTAATSCETYRRPVLSGEVYSGSTGDGVYLIDPDGPTGGGTAFPVWCDQTTETGGWTLLMRAAGTTFEYSSAAWTTTNVVNEADVSNAHGVSSKYQAFNTLPVSQLLLKSQVGNQTILALPSPSTLYARTSSSATTLLTYQSGSNEPGMLINNKDWTYCGHVWRINTKGSGAAYIRLGGWVTQQWDCNYGADQAGQPTGAHLLGFGLRDDQWSPGTYKIKSFGVRDAHDQNYLNPGQFETSGHIYGR
jgi:hypothetical protein